MHSIRVGPAPDLALLAQGIRTNAEGADQVTSTLREMGVTVHRTHLPPGTMHLMGQLRIMDSDLAVAWRGRLPQDAVDLLAEAGFVVRFLPDEEEDDSDDEKSSAAGNLNDDDIGRIGSVLELLINPPSSSMDLDLGISSPILLGIAATYAPSLSLRWGSEAVQSG